MLWNKTCLNFRHELDRAIDLDHLSVRIPGGAVAIVLDGHLRYWTGMGKRQMDQVERFGPETIITVA